MNTLTFHHIKLDPAADPLATLTAALKALSPNPSTTLIAPTFDWNSTEQYDDFQLFIKSVNSCSTLQHITAETTPRGTSNSTRLEYVLNFIGNTGSKKYEQWKPTGTNEEVKKKKDSAKEFLDYLLSTMDHKVSQGCRIYQLEDVHAHPGESPDELVDYLCTHADRCNFPSEEEKECNVQYRFVRALDDKELVKKLFALDLKATTAKMLVPYSYYYLRQLG